MKQYGDFLFVEIYWKLPGKEIVFETSNPSALWIDPGLGPAASRVKLPPGEWEIICRSDKITEELVKTIVSSTGMPPIDMDLNPIGETKYTYEYLLNSLGITYSRFVILKKVKQ